MRDFADQKIDKSLQDAIIEVLKSNLKQKDTLDGILLGVYEKVINQLSTEILRNLGYLISTGIIEKQEDSDGKIHYKIVDAPHERSQMLHVDESLLRKI